MSPKCPRTIEIEGKKYTRDDAPKGDRHVCVLDRGWIFVGGLLVLDDGTHVLSDCHNIRKWARNGFGGLIEDPKAAGAVLDSSGDMKFTNPIFTIPVDEDWGNNV